MGLGVAMKARLWVNLGPALKWQWHGYGNGPGYVMASGMAGYGNGPGYVMASGMAVSNHGCGNEGSGPI